MGVDGSSAACFVQRAKEEEKANDTSHVQVKENENEAIFVGLRIYSRLLNFIILFWNKWF